MLQRVAIVAGAVILGLVLAVRFANPGMTETQLFVAFWPLWLICLLVLVFIARIGARR